EGLPRGDIPEPDSGIISTTGECTAIRGKCETMDAAGMLSLPEQGTVLQVPEFDSAIPTPGGERTLIRTEGECLYRSGMRMPGQVQRFPVVTPHACSSAPAAYSPVVPIGARRHLRARAKAPGNGGLLQGSARKHRP